MTINMFCVLKAMRRKARSLGLDHLLTANAQAKQAVHMAMALPLLPQELIAEGFGYIKTFCDQQGVGQDLTPFLNYVNHTWIQGYLYLLFFIFF